MNFENVGIASRQESLLSTHVVLRNTYLLLSLTLLFSAGTAYFAMASNARFVNVWLFLILAYGLMFLTVKLRNSAWGLASIFAFTGFMGYTLGPMINSALKIAHGNEIIMTALGATGLVFFGLSAITLVTRKDFSFLANFLFVGMLVLVVAMLASVFFKIPALYLAISASFILFSSLAILMETSSIIHGGQTNYILATISLYVSIYNIFISLLNILSIMDRR